MLNLVLFISGALQIHSALAIVDRARKERWVIILAYTAAIALTIFFIIYPDSFLLPSVSKMYFTNYYVPGTLNILRIFFLSGVAVPYMAYVLLKAAHSSADQLKKKQYAYIAASFSIGYLIIFIPNFLVYNIQVDPLWGLLFAPVMIIPFLYGSIKYEMLNVKIIAKQAFTFAIAVAAVGSVITLFNYSNVWIREIWPTFPLWITAFISAVLTVMLSIIVWQKLRKNDLLRYEFITTVTHKFRTPLTHIKWSAENISKSKISPEVNEQLGHIVSANAKLVELTNLLVKTSEIEGSNYGYRLEKVDLSYLVKELVGTMTRQFIMKDLTISKELSPGLFVRCDVSRIQFVLQTLIDNAVNYTKSGGEIMLKTSSEGKTIVFSVTDSGIGISKNELPFIFSKFYRGPNARLEDTEGMGIGLFMSKEILAKQNGKIWVESLGEGKGSTFSFSLPIAS